MMRSFMTAGVALLTLAAASTAVAQTAPGGGLSQAPAGTPSPATVGKDNVPVPPADRAFDPGAQQLAMLHIGEVTPAMRRIGKTSPISAVPAPASGAPMPVMSLEAPSLRAVPGADWQLTLTMSNNTNRPIDARLLCVFRNGDRPVADIHVLLRNVQAGDQIAADVSGPPVTTFVSTAVCNVLDQPGSSDRR